RGGDAERRTAGAAAGARHRTRLGGLEKSGVWRKGGEDGGEVRGFEAVGEVGEVGRWDPAVVVQVVLFVGEQAGAGQGGAVGGEPGEEELFDADEAGAVRDVVAVYGGGV